MGLEEEEEEEEVEDGDVEEEEEECRCKRCLTPQIGRSNISIKFFTAISYFHFMKQKPRCITRAMNDPEEPLNSVSYIDRLSRWGLSIVRVHWTGLDAGFSPV